MSGRQNEPAPDQLEVEIEPDVITVGEDGFVDDARSTAAVTMRGSMEKVDELADALQWAAAQYEIKARHDRNATAAVKQEHLRLAREADGLAGQLHRLLVRAINSSADEDRL